MKALIDKESHTMLCPEILSYASYMDKISAMGEDIASANYNQEPIDLKGQLYTSFKTYDDVQGTLPASRYSLPSGIIRIRQMKAAIICAASRMAYITRRHIFLMSYILRSQWRIRSQWLRRRYSSME